MSKSSSDAKKKKSSLRRTDQVILRRFIEPRAYGSWIEI